MTKPFVFLSGDIGKTGNYARAFFKAGFDLTDDFSNADALCLCGGGDVAPCLYGEVNTDSHEIDLERDGRELFLLRKFLCHDKPVLAICRGAQIANVYFGGTLKQNVEGHSRVNDKDSYHTVEFLNGLSSVFGKTGTVNSAHHQSVKRLGYGLKVTAFSRDGVIEGFEAPCLHAFQFHPERLSLPNADGGKIFRKFYNDYFGQSAR